GERRGNAAAAVPGGKRGFGEKNRGSEETEDFPGHRRSGGSLDGEAGADDQPEISRGPSQGLPGGQPVFRGTDHSVGTADGTGSEGAADRTRSGRMSAASLQYAERWGKCISG